MLAIHIVEILIGVGLIIFIHEGGHFVMAKRNGVRVEIFSLGFGPAIFSWRRGDTEYRVSWIPLGGYVKMAGEQSAEKIDPQPDELTAKGPWARFQIFIAGAVMNLVLAFPILILAAIVGKWEYDPVVAAPGTAESYAGMMPGDRVVSVDDVPVVSMADYKMLVVGKPIGSVARVQVLRDGKPLPNSLEVVVGESSFHNVLPPATMIMSLTPESPLAKAGVRAIDDDARIPGDVISAVNGKPVFTQQQVHEKLLEQAGNPVEVTLTRLAAGPGETSSTRTVTVTPELKKERPYFPADDYLSEPIVDELKGGTPAGRDGDAGPLLPGDRIVAIGETPIGSWYDLKQALRPLAGVETPITIERKGARQTLTLKPGRNDEGAGVLGITPRFTKVVADVRPGSIYDKAGLKPGDTILKIRDSEQDLSRKEITVASLARESNPLPVIQTHPIMDLSRFEVFLLATILFGLLALGPLGASLSRWVESERSREMARFAVALLPAFLLAQGWESLRPEARPGTVTPVKIVVKTAGAAEQRELTIAPEGLREVDIAALGVKEWGHQNIYRARPLGEAIAYGFQEPVRITVLTVTLLKKLAKGEESSKGLAGPLGILQFSLRSAEQSIGNLLWILGLITVNLGVFNLLPIPLLDGGHVALLPYEVITRRRPSFRFEQAYQLTGLVLLLGMVVFVTWNDIQRIWG